MSDWRKSLVFQFGEDGGREMMLHGVENMEEKSETGQESKNQVALVLDTKGWSNINITSN